MRMPSSLCLASVFSALVATRADAQPFGTFRWQLQPFCNVVVVNVTQQGGIYQVDGFDDQCGAAQRAPLVGLATPNPDGTIGFGLNIVTAPGGQAVHVDARISLPSIGGQWSDSAGNSGTFAFGASAAGTPRPPARIGAASVDPAQVQLRVAGACVPGQLIQAINQDGTVTCVPVGDVDEVRPGLGLTGGGTSGTVALGLQQAVSGAFEFLNNSGLVALANAANGGIAAEGPGGRLLYFPGQDAFRVGRVTGTQWDARNIGRYSVATGLNTIASGVGAVAMGAIAEASGANSFAIGEESTAGGDTSMVFGFRGLATAAADGSFVFADRSSSNRFTSFAPNEFVVRAAGGVGFYSNAGTSSGVELAASGSSWASLSDVNVKENFTDVDGEDVLAKLSAMSIQEWNYKAQDASIRHMGPTAQEFRAAFGLGDFALRINTIDADGVALSAVKALDARTRRMNESTRRENESLQRDNETLRRDNEALRARLEQLEERVRRSRQ